MDDKSKNYFASLVNQKGSLPAKEAKPVVSDIDQEVPVEAGLDTAEPTASLSRAENVSISKPKKKTPRMSDLDELEGESENEAADNDVENGALPKTIKGKSELDFEGDDFWSDVEGQLTVDVFQTPEEIVIQSTVAGVKSEDLEIDITGESISIKGQRQRNQKVSDEDYFYQECYWGRFSRSIILPQEINPDKAKASLNDGVLTIHLPKLERDRSKKLRVKIN